MMVYSAVLPELQAGYRARRQVWPPGVWVALAKWGGNVQLASGAMVAVGPFLVRRDGGVGKELWSPWSPADSDWLNDDWEMV